MRPFILFKNVPFQKMNQIINKSVDFRDLGLLDYQEAWDYQEELFAETVAC